MRRVFRARVVSAVLFTLLLASCKRSDQEIKLYRVAKPGSDSAPERDTGAPADAASLTFSPGNAPPNWEPQPLSQMRQASFIVHGKDDTEADISFVTLGPSAGNILDNVNRWLAQLAQPPVTAEKLATMVQQLPTERGNIALVDLTGEPENGAANKDGRIIAAIASDAGGTAFYKMRGNRTLVGAEKENFVNWVNSSQSGTAPIATENMPATSDSAQPQVKWDLPAEWHTGAPSPMRYASFTADENGATADISVVMFPGEGGGDLENVNRWRQQIGLPAVDAGALQSMISTVANDHAGFSLVDMRGSTARTIAAWVRHEGRVWFFKITGPKEAVLREQPRFLAFLQSVRF